MMKNKNILFFILSPYRAKEYDFDNLIMPSETELLIISDAATLEKFVPSNRFSTQEIPLTEYKNYGIDFLSLDAIEDLVKHYLQLQYSIRLHTDEELLLDDVALFNDKFHLDGMGVEETKIFRDKYCMKAAIKKDPQFFKIPRYTQNIADAKNFTFPIIIKPLAMAGSLGVLKINTLPELLEHMKSVAGADYIIEEFINGDVYHCDALVYEGEIKFFLSGKHFFPFEYATKNLSYLGSEIVNSPEIIDRLHKATEETIRLLNIQSSIIHLELILNEKGLFFVEIGKRPAGGWTSKMYHIAYGINLFNYHLYSSYPTFPLKTAIQLSIYNKYGCGIHLLRQNDDEIKEVYLPLPSEGAISHYFLEKWKPTRKTNSLMDYIAEVYFFSNSENDYQQNLEHFLANYKIISEPSLHE